MFMDFLIAIREFAKKKNKELYKPSGETIES